MTRLKYDIPYEEKMIILGPKGEKIEVGSLIEKKDDKENRVCSYIIELLPNLPEELQKAIETEPRILRIMQVSKQATSILILP